MTTTATHRPGCRTGRALIRPGRSSTCGAMTSADRRVYREVTDRPALGLPPVEDLLVAPVLLHRLERVDDGLAELGLVLGEHEAVGGRVVLLAEQLDGALGQLHGGDGRREVDRHGVCLAGLD